MTDAVSVIVDRIRRNRISTTEVSDCLGKTGVLDGVLPVVDGFHAVGPVFWAYAYGESNWELHEQLRHVDAGSVVVVEAFDCNDRAVLGGLVSKFVLLYRQAVGLAVQGYVRDVPQLIRERWPVWTAGRTPIGCFNRKNDEPFPAEVIEERRRRYEGAIAVCDDAGVVVIPPDRVDETFVERLDWIEEQEDIWFDCIDRRKWDTYDTVCLKRYNDEP